MTNLHLLIKESLKSNNQNLLPNHVKQPETLPLRSEVIFPALILFLLETTAPLGEFWPPRMLEESSISLGQLKVTHCNLREGSSLGSET